MPAVDKVYNAGEVVIDFAGNVIAAGFADGEFCRIVPSSNVINKVVGTNGEVAVSVSYDKTATVVIKLLQTSDANDLLSALRARQRRGPGIAGAGPLRIRDLQGRTLHEAPKAWIEKGPEVSFDKTATAREWTIGVGQLESFDGGNNAV